MKFKIAIAFCLSLLTLQSSGQPQNWTWAKSAGGNAQDQSRKIVADTAGNVYVAGFYGSPTITIGSTTLTNSGGNDIFLLKYDASGTITWARSFGGTGSEGVNGLCLDPSGNVLIAGVSNSSTLNIGTVTLSTNGGVDLFVAKFNSNGNVLWAKSNGGSGSDEGQDIAVDSSGAVYLAGSFTSASLVFGGTTLIVSGTRDGFLTKYDSAGTEIWAKSIGGTSSDRCIGVTLNNSGEVLVTGAFTSSSIQIGSITLSNVGGDDAFTAKYDGLGNALWAKSGGGSLADNPKGIATDAAGNVYVAGFFNSSSCTFGAITLVKVGGVDPYIIKYDNAGNLIWAKNTGGTGIEVFNGISSDAVGNTIVIGNFDASFSVGGTSLSNAGLEDILTIKFDPSGSVIWAKRVGGPAVDLGYGSYCDLSGNLYFTGQFESSSCTFGTTTLSNNGGWDIFVAKMNAVPTGINQIAGSNIAWMYPNPAADKVIIEVMNSDQDMQLILSDLSGKILYTVPASGDRTEIYTHDFPAGIYTVTLRSQHVSDTRKLILVR